MPTEPKRRRPARSRNGTKGRVKAADSPVRVPTGFDTSLLDGFSHDELIALVEQIIGGGITVNFSGKANATQIARKVRPRVVRRIKTLSVGDQAAQADNLLIEGSGYR